MMLLDDLLAEAQAYAGTLWFGGEEWNKDTVQNLRQYTDAMVAYGYLHATIGLSACMQFYDTVACLGCVLHKIHKHLHKQSWVGINLKSGGGPIATKPVAIELLQVVEIFLHGYCFALRLGYACQLAVVVDKVQLSLAAPVYYAQCLFCLGGSVGGMGFLGF